MGDIEKVGCIMGGLVAHELDQLHRHRVQLAWPAHFLTQINDLFDY